MDREMEGTDTTNPNELSTEQLRANAFASASSNMNQLALNSQKEVLQKSIQYHIISPSESIPQK